MVARSLFRFHFGVEFIEHGVELGDIVLLGAHGLLIFCLWLQVMAWFIKLS